MNEKGFTIIEVLIGLIILAFGLLAIAGMQVTSIKGNFFSRNMTEASILAQDRLEVLKNLDWSHSDLSFGTHDEGQIPGTLFSRKYTVSQVSGTNMLNITVTVNWRDETDHTISFTTIKSK